MKNEKILNFIENEIAKSRVIIRPPRYNPEYVKMKRLGPKGIVDARERDRKMYMLMQECSK